MDNLPDLVKTYFVNFTVITTVKMFRVKKLIQTESNKFRSPDYINT